jgi:Ion channel
MGLLNYLELCFDFAIFYRGLGLIRNSNTATDALYFSFITASTVGYGDMSPISKSGRLLVILQCVCSLVFITLVFAKYVAEFEMGKSKIGSDK